jgi:hypothetical protein
MMFPLTLYVVGQAKALQKDLGGVGLVAGAVILAIGGMMTICKLNTGSTSLLSLVSYHFFYSLPGYVAATLQR